MPDVHVSLAREVLVPTTPLLLPLRVGTSRVPAQMWLRLGEHSPGADMGGASQVPAQMWQVCASPGADVSAVSPVPAQMLAGGALRTRTR